MEFRSHHLAIYPWRCFLGSIFIPGDSVCHGVFFCPYFGPTFLQIESQIQILGAYFTHSIVQNSKFQCFHDRGVLLWICVLVSIYVPRNIAICPLIRINIHGSSTFSTSGSVNELPVFFQLINHDSASISGVQGLPTSLGFIITATIGGAAATITGKYIWQPQVGTLLMTVGAGVLSLIAYKSDVWFESICQFIFGLGCGFLMQYAVMFMCSISPPTSSKHSSRYRGLVLTGQVCLEPVDHAVSPYLTSMKPFKPLLTSWQYRLVQVPFLSSGRLEVSQVLQSLAQF